MFRPIPHIPGSRFTSLDPFSLGDSWGDSEDEMLETQHWFDQHAPGMFRVVAVDYPDSDSDGISDEGAPATMYYLISKI